MSESFGGRRLFMPMRLQRKISVLLRLFSVVRSSVRECFRNRRRVLLLVVELTEGR
jgi:hypothetical protein